MFTQADAYERFMGRWSRKLADVFVRFAGLAQARRVLDVGSGTGALAEAALAASPNAEVVGIDPSPAFVERASAEIGGRARFVVGDAQQLPFDDSCFDACCSLLVLNFIPNQRQALAEMRRVTKLGGTIAAAVWDHAEGMNMLRVFWEVADAVDPDKHVIEEPQPMLSRDALIAMWREAGFTGIGSAPLVFDMHFASFADYWEPFGLGQGPAGLYLSGVSSAIRERIALELRQRLVMGRDEVPFTLSARAWGVRGQR